MFIGKMVYESLLTPKESYVYSKNVDDINATSTRSHRNNLQNDFL